MPALTACIDLAEWDARAKSLGGTSNSLFAGFASRLGVLSGGAFRGDGAVTLSFPVSERTENDSRGNALTTAVVTLRPHARSRADLSGIRSQDQAGLGRARGKAQRAVDAATSNTADAEEASQEAGGYGTQHRRSSHRLLQHR